MSNSSKPKASPTAILEASVLVSVWASGVLMVALSVFGS